MRVSWLQGAVLVASSVSMGGALFVAMQALPGTFLDAGGDWAPADGRVLVALLVGRAISMVAFAASTKRVGLRGTLVAAALPPLVAVYAGTFIDDSYFPESVFVILFSAVVFFWACVVSSALAWRVQPALAKALMLDVVAAVGFVFVSGALEAWYTAWQSLVWLLFAAPAAAHAFAAVRGMASGDRLKPALES